MASVSGNQPVYQINISNSIGLGFMLKQLQKQLKASHSQCNLLPLPHKFPYEFGWDVQIQGQKAGIQKDVVDREHLLHNMNWTVPEREVFILGFGYNFINWTPHLDRITDEKLKI